eukprot:scaffold14596_cov59-Phaeocystis_antarctica.AAC.4
MLPAEPETVGRSEPVSALMVPPPPPPPPKRPSRSGLGAAETDWARSRDLRRSSRDLKRSSRDLRRRSGPRCRK